MAVSGAELQFLIYKITCVVTGKAYVGQTKGDVAHRWAKHVYTACKMGRGCPALHAAIRLYGREAFTVETIAAAASQEECNAAEASLIELHGTMAPSGYNLSSGGNVMPRSDETRAKISAAMKGRPSPLKGTPRTLEVRERMSRNSMGLQKRGTGWKHSGETRAKIAWSRRGVM